MTTNTKLNKIERLKQELKPYNFDINSVDFSNLSEADRFYLKNFGIYNIKLASNKFMLRIRVDGGVIEKAKLLALIALAREFGLKIIFTTRAQLELHNILPSDILELYSRVKELGLTTHQSLTDNIRAVTIDSYDAIASDSKIDCYPILKEIQDIFLDNPDFFGTLPRKFNCSLIGRVTPLMNPWANDLLFALAKSGEDYGFNIYVGGKNSEVAKSLNVFVLPSEVVKFFKAFLQSFIELGLRGSRSKTRLFNLLEAIGIDSFRDEVQSRFGSTLKEEAKLIMQSSKYSTKTELKDGFFAHIYKTNYGEPNLDELEDIIKNAKQFRLGADQNLHIIGLDKNASNSQKAPIRACAGSRYCPLSLWDIKQDVDTLKLDRFTKLGISVGFSGCLKGCGHHLHSDIGLVGLRTNLYGATQKALRLYFGATELPNPQPARLLYYAVPLNKIDSFFTILVKDFTSSGFEQFKDYSRFLYSYKIELLQLWYLLLGANLIDSSIKEKFFSKNFNVDEVEIMLLKLTDYMDINLAISKLSHTLWDS